MAFGECLRKIEKPAQTQLERGGNFRIRVLKAMTFPRYNWILHAWYHQVELQGGKFLPGQRKVYGGRADLDGPIHYGNQPLCTLRYRLGLVSDKDSSAVDHKCYTLSEQGKFCEEYDTLVGSLKAGDTIDLDNQGRLTPMWSSCRDGGDDHAADIRFIDEFVEKSRVFKSRDPALFPKNRDARPDFDTEVYELFCQIPNGDVCSRQPESYLTVQTLLDAFPAGSIEVLSLDKNAESCTEAR